MLWKWQKELVQKILKLGRKVYPDQNTGKTCLPVIEDETAIYLQRLRVIGGKSPKPIDESGPFISYPDAEDRMHRIGNPKIVDIVIPDDFEIKQLLERKRKLLNDL